MRQDLPPQINRHHLKALRDLMITKGLGLQENRSDQSVSGRTCGPQHGQDPIGIRQGDVCQSVGVQFRSGGYRYDTGSLEKDISRTICGLQILFGHPDRGLSFILTEEEVSSEISGWCSAALIGETKRAARRQLKKRKDQGSCDRHVQLTVQSTQVTEWLWAIFAKRVAGRMMSTWTWPQITKAELLDRLQRALLWRLTRVPEQEGGKRLHGGDLLRAMELYVGDDVRLKEAEGALSQLFADWREWLRLSSQIRQEQQAKKTGQQTDSPFGGRSTPRRLGSQDPLRVCNTADERFIHAACRWIDHTLQWTKENIRKKQWPTRLENSRRFLWELQRRLNSRIVRRQKAWENGKRQVFDKTPEGGERATGS